eukprot:748846-Hanusia_phi.AAC.1
MGGDWCRREQTRGELLRLSEPPIVFLPPYETPHVSSHLLLTLLVSGFFGHFLEAILEALSSTSRASWVSSRSSAGMRLLATGQDCCLLLPPFNPSPLPSVAPPRWTGF